jgi:hypothetical protein
LPFADASAAVVDGPELALFAFGVVGAVTFTFFLGLERVAMIAATRPATTTTATTLAMMRRRRRMRCFSTAAIASRSF